MPLIIFLTLFITSMPNETPIVDFKTSTGQASIWYIVNDDVMGGKSQSNFTIHDTTAVFTGQVSLENNGGFAMVKHPTRTLIDSNQKQLHLRVKGDGKRYQIRLKSSEDQNYAYQQTFETSGEWEDIFLKLSACTPSFRGRALDLPSFNSHQITEFAILIGNKVEEPFRLEIEFVSLI